MSKGKRIPSVLSRELTRSRTNLPQVFPSRVAYYRGWKPLLHMLGIVRYVFHHKVCSRRFSAVSVPFITWRTARFMALFLLLVLFAQLAFGSRLLSLTSDEPPHLAAGYTYLTTGETWHIPSLGNPPLLIAWMALPIVLGNPHIPLQSLPNWHTSALPPYFRALFPLLGPVEQLEVVGRVPVMLLSVLLGGLIFRWAADLFGPKGGLLALALMVFDPTMLAHSQLATIDVGVTMLGFATFFVSWRWVRADLPASVWDLSFGICHLLLVGLLSGATLAAKMSGLIWLGLVWTMTTIWLTGRAIAIATGRIPIWAGGRVSRHTDLPVYQSTCSLLRALGAVAGRAVVMMVTALLVLWAVYGFQVGPLQIGPYSLNVPASHHWEGLLQQMSSPSVRLMFLAGEARVGGWWWYFPFAFLIKNPVPLLVIWLGAVVISIGRRIRSVGHSLKPVDFLFLLVFPVVYTAVAIYSRVNIGYRHLLPIHPFLYVLAGQWVHVGKGARGGRGRGPATAGGRQTKLTTLGRMLWAALWIWYVVGTVRIFPHYLPYFNELAGGPRNGYRYLVDSNLDWGQSFKALKEALDHLDIRPPLRLGHHWYVGPESYGVHYEPLPPLPGAPAVFSPRFDPPPGTYVLGATLLQRGRGDPEQYEWFRHHTPLAQPGYALFVFRVDPHQPPATWIAQCTEPAPPLNSESIREEFYTQPLRQIYFDCDQSWIYPEDGQTSGWYALHSQADAADVQNSSHLAAQHLGQAHLAYVHHRDDGLAPAFRLYEFRPEMRTLVYTSTVRVMPQGMAPGQVVAERPVVTAPLRLEGPLAFLGYRLLDVGSDAVALETWWQVIERPVRPLSIMGHLIGDDGSPIAVADGLGVPIEAWQVGDVLVQIHYFPLAPDLRIDGGRSAWVLTGTYWLDTMERHGVMEAGQYIGDRILLRRVGLADGS